eukprot:612644-Rhodomonas_salina.1
MGMTSPPGSPSEMGAISPLLLPPSLVGFDQPATADPPTQVGQPVLTNPILVRACVDHRGYSVPSTTSGSAARVPGYPGTLYLGVHCSTASPAQATTSTSRSLIWLRLSAANHERYPGTWSPGYRVQHCQSLALSLSATESLRLGLIGSGTQCSSDTKLALHDYQGRKGQHEMWQCIIMMPNVAIGPTSSSSDLSN